MTTTRQQHLPTYDHRQGTGPTLVLLHYWGGSARTWDLVADRLTGRDVLAVDFRGWRRSSGLPGPYTLDRLAEDTLAVLAEAGVTDHVLVGHSMGGKVAQLVAATRPAGLRGIVLVGSGPAKPAAAVTPEYRQQLSHAYDSEASATWALDHVLTATELPAPVRARVVADSRSGADAARTQWPLHGIAEDITARTRRIEVPALVVAGEQDQVEPPEVLRANLVPYLSRAEVTVIPRTGHLIPLEAPAELAEAVLGFAPAG
ncbi:alpha/beta fold hydrolase [Streptomyces sp. CA2R106]|uniref:alpha/beta fold hydrolase n=1 Tax=Streptomyces sp. CA2R106 TaxID=3120153 RepID=UPI00300A0E89